MYSKTLLFSAIFCCLLHGDDHKHRPYVSTTMAQTIVSSSPVIPEVKTECDGSGWITQGDGHRSRCPGCKKCEKGDVGPKGCGCGCVIPNCNCKNKDCDDVRASDAAAEFEYKYRVYHFGANWCLPCLKLKKEVWGSSEVTSLITSRGGKLFILDKDRSDHKPYFNAYGVKGLPTIIIVKNSDLDNPITRVVGAISKKQMLSILKEKLK